MTKMNIKTLRALLFISFFLFLLLVIYIAYLKVKEPINNSNGNEQIFSSLYEINGNKSISEKKTSDSLEPKPVDQYPASIEVEPKLPSLKNDQSLSINHDKIHYIEKEIKSPVIDESKFHSTFGKEVIFIYFTHNRESFLPYFPDKTRPEEAYHSDVNISLVGERLQHSLKQHGIWSTVNTDDIVTLLDQRNLHFGYSYEISRDIIKTEVRNNKNLELFFDIHRDSLPKEYTTTQINEIDYAKILFVVGTGHEYYKENASFAQSLHDTINDEYPGLSKGIIFKDPAQGNGIYNQDLSPSSVIIEIGGVENTFQELFRSADVLAKVVAQYYWSTYH